MQPCHNWNADERHFPAQYVSPQPRPGQSTTTKIRFCFSVREPLWSERVGTRSESIWCLWLCVGVCVRTHV